MISSFIFNLLVPFTLSLRWPLFTFISVIFSPYTREVNTLLCYEQSRRSFLFLSGCAVEAFLGCPNAKIGSSICHGGKEALETPCPKLLDTIICSACEAVSLKWIHPPREGEYVQLLINT